MKLDTFFDNFELLAEAPNGVEKLRELILQLAVMGKLVAQDENDEPASELLELIRKDRDNSIHMKLVKKSQPLPTLVAEELPFETPKGWVFERFGNLFNFIDYRGKTPKKVDSGIRLITAKNVRMGYRQDEPMEFISEDTYNEWMTRGFPERGDLLFTTEAPMGNVCLVDLDEKFALAQRTINLHPWGEQDSLYLMFAIMSPLIQGMISAKSTGMTATGIKAAKLKLVPIPIPPLPEQRRIVARVDQLMSLCDELEARREKKHKLRARLNSAALDRLTSAPGAENWRRISDNFDLLYDNAESVGELRRAILQLAVMGKLVGQEENDEPAEVLIKRVRLENKRLLQKENLTKFRLPDQVEEIDSPYKLPEGWCWVRLPEVVIPNKNSIKRGPFGSTIKKDFFVPEGNKVYEQKNAIYNDFKLGNYYIDDTKFNELKDFEVRPNDIIISCSGTIGKLAIAPTDVQKGIINQALLKLSLNNNAITNEYFSILFAAFLMNTTTLSELKGTAIKNIVSVNILKELPFPLPPLTEQRRIVTRVDQLMSLCDELEARLARSEEEGGRLVEAVVSELV